MITISHCVLITYPNYIMYRYIKKLQNLTDDINNKECDISHFQNNDFITNFQRKFCTSNVERSHMIQTHRFN